MKYEISANQLTSNQTINTDVEGWEDRVKRDIRNCIKNEYCHNYIKTADGEMLFYARDYLYTVVKPLREKHGVAGWMTETDEYRAEKNSIIESMVNEIFARLMEADA